jgi:hypothetical protein
VGPESTDSDDCRVVVSLSRNGNAADFRPDSECPRPGSSVLGGSEVIATKIEQVVDLIVSGQEALGLAGRFELLHLSFSSACRLV